MFGKACHTRAWPLLRTLVTRLLVLLPFVSPPYAAHAVPSPEEPTIERVDTIRKMLLERDNADNADTETPQQQAQYWYNWPNWNNWYNWPNWGNWYNY